VGSAPQVNDLCGLPAGAATCSGEAPHALLFDTARGATLRTSWPPSFSTLPLSGTMRGSTLPMRASGRGVTNVHACACAPQGVLGRTSLTQPWANMTVSYLPEDRLSRGKVTCRACNKELKM